MATQGMVSVVKDRKVVLKAVCGCSGYNVDKVAQAIIEENIATIQALYDKAQQLRFGCESCRVVMDESEIVYTGGDVNPLYRDTFHAPLFNPRWNEGYCYNTLVVIKEGDVWLVWDNRVEGFWFQDNWQASMPYGWQEGRLVLIPTEPHPYQELFEVLEPIDISKYEGLS